jgi:hypothetical protein
MAAAPESAQADPALVGILVLLAAERAERSDSTAVPTEILLSKAGLAPELVGRVVGKSTGAVRDMSRRAEKAESKVKRGGGAR